MPKKSKKSEGKSYSWFTWRRSTVPEVDNKKNERKVAEEVNNSELSNSTMFNTYTTKFT